MLCIHLFTFNQSSFSASVRPYINQLSHSQLKHGHIVGRPTFYLSSRHISLLGIVFSYPMVADHCQTRCSYITERFIQFTTDAEHFTMPSKSWPSLPVCSVSLPNSQWLQASSCSHIWWTWHTSAILACASCLLGLRSTRP